MERYDTIDEFVERAADELLTGANVYFDLIKRQFTSLRKEWTDDFEINFAESDAEEFEEIAKTRFTEIDPEIARDIKEALTLPDNIETPNSHIQYGWRKDFIKANCDNAAFCRNAIKALSDRHPFRSFKDTLNFHNLTEQWHDYERDRMLSYIRHELFLD